MEIARYIFREINRLKNEGLKIDEENINQLLPNFFDEYVKQNAEMNRYSGYTLEQMHQELIQIYDNSGDNENEEDFKQNKDMILKICEIIRKKFNSRTKNSKFKSDNNESDSPEQKISKNVNKLNLNDNRSLLKMKINSHSKLENNLNSDGIMITNPNDIFDPSPKNPQPSREFEFNSNDQTQYFSNNADQILVKKALGTKKSIKSSKSSQLIISNQDLISSPNVLKQSVNKKKEIGSQSIKNNQIFNNKNAYELVPEEDKPLIKEIDLGAQCIKESLSNTNLNNRYKEPSTLDEKNSLNDKNSRLIRTINDALTKYQLNQSFWGRWMDNKKNYYNNYGLLGAIRLPDSKIDESLEIRKFESEYERFIERNHTRNNTQFISLDLKDMKNKSHSSLLPPLKEQSNSTIKPLNTSNISCNNGSPSISRKSNICNPLHEIFPSSTAHSIALSNDTKIENNNHYTPFKYSNHSLNIDPNDANYTAKFSPNAKYAYILPSTPIVNQSRNYSTKNIKLDESITLKEPIIYDNNLGISPSSRGNSSFGQRKYELKNATPNLKSRPNLFKLHPLPIQQNDSIYKSVISMEISETSPGIATLNSNQEIGSSDQIQFSSKEINECTGPDGMIDESSPQSVKLKQKQLLNSKANQRNHLSLILADDIIKSRPSTLTSPKTCQNSMQEIQNIRNLGASPKNYLPVVKTRSNNLRISTLKSYQQTSINPIITDQVENFVIADTSSIKSGSETHRNLTSQIDFMNSQQSQKTLPRPKSSIFLETSLNKNLTKTGISTSKPLITISESTLKNDSENGSYPIYYNNTSMNIANNNNASFNAYTIQKSKNIDQISMNNSELKDDSINQRDSNLETFSQEKESYYLSSSINSYNNNTQNTCKMSLAEFLTDIEYKGPINKIKFLGNGSEAKVYLSRFNGCNELFALKIYEFAENHNKGMELFDTLKLEFYMLRQINHDNIIKYYCLYKPEKTKYKNCLEHGIIMEYLPGGSLENYIDDYFEQINIKDKYNFMKQILSALSYLHKCKIIHRDLKPGNILLTADKKSIKISDFGISVKTNNNSLIKRTFIGTPWYMAPEVISEEAYSNNADIWSAGCCFYHLITGKKPHHAITNPYQAMMHMVNKKNPLDVDDITLINEIKKYDGLYDFLELCFIRKPSKRPDADALLKHLIFDNQQKYTNIELLKLKFTK